jgi:hypothetical protein
MSEPDRPDPARDTLPIIGNASAPFVYWDAIAAIGTNNGAIELELCSRTMIPLPDGVAVRNEVVITAHLRCSPAAATALRDGIGRALDMLAQSQQPQQQAPSQLH